MASSDSLHKTRILLWLNALSLSCATRWFIVVLMMPACMSNKTGNA